METKTNHDYTRRNRFTGQSIELTEEEANRHDAIFYHEALATLEDKDMDDPGISSTGTKLREHLDWFSRTQCQSLHGIIRLN